MISPALLSPLRFLEQEPVFGVMAKEFLGVNLPRIAINRTPEERADTTVAELGNLLGFFGTGFILDKLLNGFYNGLKVAPSKAKALGKKSTEQVKKHWRQLGKTVALCGFLSAWMLAIPFFRNFYTAERTGTTAFTEVINKNEKQLDSKKELKAKENQYLNAGFWTIGAGVGLVIASMIGSAAAVKRGIQLGKVAEKGKNGLLKSADWVRRKIGLKDGKFEDFGKNHFHPLAFWALTSYGGMVIAARDKFEAYEQIFKFFNFVLWFSVLPVAIGRNVFKRAVPQKIKQHITKQPGEKSVKSLTHKLIENLKKSKKITTKEENKLLKTWRNQELVKMLSSIALLGISPNLLNIALTNWRLNRQSSSVKPPQGALNQSMPNQLNVNQHLLERKSFAQFTHQLHKLSVQV